jgi:hypothetical protein
VTHLGHARLVAADSLRRAEILLELLVEGRGRIGEDSVRELRTIVRSLDEIACGRFDTDTIHAAYARRPRPRRRTPLAKVAPLAEVIDLASRRRP